MKSQVDPQIQQSASQARRAFIANFRLPIADLPAYALGSKNWPPAIGNKVHR
jgi:hypothetical protein